MGIDAITGPHAVESIVQQFETITDQQDEFQLTPDTDSVIGSTDRGKNL